jgi:hypothetical protein
MAEIVRETVTTRDEGSSAPNSPEVSNTQTVNRLIYFVFGALEILLVFRLLFKLAGASYGSYFVNFIYSLSGIFVAPFFGIFRSTTTTGIETTAVLEPATMVAILVYAVVAWGIVSLVRILSGKREEE